MSSFVANRLAEVPPALNGPEGQALARALGEAQDDEATRLRIAALSRLPALCPDDALDGVGAWLELPRFEGEGDGTYRGRLVAGWTTWSEAGSAQAIEDSLRAYGIPDVRVVEEGESPTLPGSWYSRFRVELGPDFGATGIAAPLLGDVTLGDFYLGTTATVRQRRAINAQVLKWKAVHALFVDVIYLYSTGGGISLGVAPLLGLYTPLGGFHLGVYNLP
jgi:hypothetical protein